MLFGYFYLLLFTFGVVTKCFLPINVDSSIEISNYMQFSIIPFLSSKLRFPRTFVKFKENNKIFIILTEFFTRIKKEVIDLKFELIYPFRLLFSIYLNTGFRSVLNHIIQHFKINYIKYLKKIGWFIIFTLIVFLVRNGVYYIIFNNQSLSLNLKDLVGVWEIFKYDAILVFLLVRVNNRIIIMTIFRLFKKPLGDTIVEIDKCYNTNFCSLLDKFYSISKVRFLINKLKSFKSNIESYIVNLFNLLKIYWFNLRTPSASFSDKKDYSFKKGWSRNDTVILMLPASLQASSSKTPQREIGQEGEGSNTTGPSSLVDTVSSHFNLVKNHHLFNSNIEFINKEQSNLNAIIANINNKLEPFEKKRLIHLQNGGSNNNTSQVFTTEDLEKYSQYNNEISNLKESYERLTVEFKEHQRIKELADDLDSAQNTVNILNKKLSAWTRRCNEFISIKKELTTKLKAHDKDRENFTFTNEEFLHLLHVKDEIKLIQKFKSKLDKQIEAKETFIATFTRRLRKEKLSPLTRESQIITEAITEHNPVP